MMEERLEKVDNEIKSLKASMPVAGSMLDTYFYTKVSSAVYPDGATANYRVRFIPADPSGGLGITNVYTYCESLASVSPWSQYNPVYLAVDSGYYKNISGEAVFDDSFSSTGYGTCEVRITAAVSSTVPGSIKIELY